MVAALAAALARVGDALFAALAELAVQAVSGRAGPGQAEPAFVLVAPFELRDLRILHRGDRVEPRPRGAGAHRQTVAERTADPGREPVPVAAALARGAAALGGRAAAPLAARLARDDVHDAAERLRSVQHRQGAAHDLDPLDVLDPDPVVLEVRVADDTVAGADPAAVDEEQGVPTVQPAQADHLAPADRASLQRHPGLAANRFEHVVGAALLDVAPRDDGHCRRRIDLEDRMARRGDDHHRQIDLGRRRRGGAATQGAGRG